MQKLPVKTLDLSPVGRNSELCLQSPYWVLGPCSLGAVLSCFTATELSCQEMLRPGGGSHETALPRMKLAAQNAPKNGEKGQGEAIFLLLINHTKQHFKVGWQMASTLWSPLFSLEADYELSNSFNPPFLLDSILCTFYCNAKSSISIVKKTINFWAKPAQPQLPRLSIWSLLPKFCSWDVNIQLISHKPTNFILTQSLSHLGTTLLSINLLRKLSLAKNATASYIYLIANIC